MLKYSKITLCPDGLVGEDLTADFTGIDPTLYKTETSAGPLDKLIEENGQIPPLESTSHVGD